MVNEEDLLYQLYCNGRHSSDSHSNYEGEYLGPFQKAGMIRAVQNNPNAAGSMVIWNMANVDSL